MVSSGHSLEGGKGRKEEREMKGGQRGKEREYETMKKGRIISMLFSDKLMCTCLHVVALSQREVPDGLSFHCKMPEEVTVHD